jgi:hypothetical protein
VPEEVEMVLFHGEEKNIFLKVDLGVVMGETVVTFLLKHLFI